MKPLIRKWGLDVLAVVLLIAAIFAVGCNIKGATAGRSAEKTVSEEESAVASGNVAKFGVPGSIQTGINGNVAEGQKAETRTEEMLRLRDDAPALSLDAPSTLPAGGGGIGPKGAVFGVGGNRKSAQQLAQLPVPASSLPNASEEIWIISKPAKNAAANVANNDDAQPRSGALVVQKDQKTIPCPLKHTDVKARVDGFIASVDVTQQYTNPFSEKIEATYVFPLPENAAINEFVMTIGDRTIRGIIREKEEAKQIYAAAKQQGYTASLLQQDRPNVFTQKVANIEPGKQIDISIRYFNTLAYVDGWYEFVFPMVVGPRFNPPGTTDGIGAVSRNNTGASQQKTEVQYLAPAERSGHDISLEVALNAGVAIEQVESVNHIVENAMVKQIADNPGFKIVRIAPNDRIPNKDFVLRYKVAGKQLKQAVFTQADKDGRGGYFALLMVPPETTVDLPRRPVELCFTLDVSGSMSGAPIEQSRAAMRYALQNMNPDDTFQVIRFAGGVDQLSPDALTATPANVNKGLKFVESMNAGGGTMMLQGITTALNQSVKDEERVRYVCLLTDGFIGNEAQLIKATHDMRGATKVFGFGVGSSPNRYLIDGMSRAGAGAVAYLSLNDKGEEVMQPFFDRISKPALTNIAVDATNLSGAEIYPAKVPDVYVGRAVVITGRYQGDGGTLLVKARGPAGPVEQRFEIRPSKNAETNASLAAVWARQKISSLCDRMTIAQDESASPQIKQVALDYSLMSDFTSFVAVDSSRVTAGNHGVSVVQPVPVPDGVRYDTTVQTPDKTNAE